MLLAKIGVASRVFVFLGAAMFFSACANAHEVNSRVVVIGEDEDTIAVPKTNEIYKRVVAKLQNSLLRHAIFVIDEDMIGAKLGFDIPSRRSKADILEMMQVVNTTTDASVQSRLLVLFSIIPNVHEMSVTRKLDVRVRGQVFDLQSLRALSSFEVKNQETVTIPKKSSMCNDLCIQEKAGEVASSLATELGEILVLKLEKIIEASSNSNNAALKDSALGSVYTLKLTLFKKSETLRLKRTLAYLAGVAEVKLLKSSQTEVIYSVSTALPLGVLEEEILLMLMDFGVDIDQVRTTSFNTELSFEML